MGKSFREIQELNIEALADAISANSDESMR